MVWEFRNQDLVAGFPAKAVPVLVVRPWSSPFP
jgi:hypothetical protein